MPDATQGDQRELVGDCTHPVFKYWEKLAAQGEGIFQEDTRGRVLALIEENQQATAQAQARGEAKAAGRTGMQTTALIVQIGERRICLSYTGRRHASENLELLLAQRELGRGKPLGMSEALSSNKAEEARLSRGPCLAQGRRKFSELAEDFPAESTVVVEALKLGYDHDEQARDQQLTVHKNSWSTTKRIASRS